MPGTQYCTAHTWKPGTKAAPESKPKRKKPFWHKWYHTAQWKNLRLLVLHRDPICKICRRVASTVADHIIPHRGNRSLFADMANLQGVCKVCHDIKTASEDGGFGNEPEAPNTPAATGEKEGKLFTSTTVGDAALDAALAEED